MARILTRAKLALSAITLISPYAVVANEPPNTHSIMHIQAFPDIYQAVRQAEKEFVNEVKVGATSLRRVKNQGTSGQAKVFMSEDNRSKILIKQKDGITYGSAIIGGDSYSIFNGQIEKFDTPHTHTDDVVFNTIAETEDAHFTKQRRKVRIKEAELLESLTLSPDGKATTPNRSLASNSSNSNVIYVTIDGERQAVNPVFINKFFDELTAQEMFTAEKASEVISRASTLSSYTQSSLNSAISVDHVVTAGAILEEYKDWGVLALELIEAQIDSKIEGSNIILENSQLGNMNLANSSISLITEFNEFAVGNTLVDRYRSGQERILYAAVDMNSQFWGDRDEGICGFAQMPQIVKMENPDMRTVGDMGANKFLFIGAENQDWNMHGISRLGCLDSRVFLHEVGHSNGLDHDRANASRAGDFEFKYGFASSEEGRYSVMGYPCEDCFYEPLIASPDNYDFILGISPYDIDGADAFTFLSTSFWLKYMPLEKQTQYITPSQSTVDENSLFIVSSAITQTYEWETHQGGEVQMLVILDWVNDNYYFLPLPFGTSSLTIDTSDLPSFGIDGYIVSGLAVGDAVQPIVTHRFDINTRLAQTETGFRSSSNTAETVFPDVIEKGGVYDLSFTLDEEGINRLQERFNDPIYSDWEVSASSLNSFTFHFDIDVENVITVTNSIEDIIETGRIEATLTMPDEIEMSKLLRSLYDNDQKPNDFYDFNISLTALLTDSFGSSARFTQMNGTFSLKTDSSAFYNVIRVTADELLIAYRKEDTTAFPVTFSLESDSGAFKYEIVEGYTDTGLSASAVTDTTSIDNGDGSMTLTVMVDPSVITQAQDQGYFITVSAVGGIPATASTLLKDNDVPYYGSNDDLFTATDENFEFSLVVEDLLSNTEYAIELVSFSENFSQLITVPSEYVVENIDSTSKRFTIDAFIAGALSDNYAVRVYPVDENGEATGREASRVSHRYDFVIEYNVAPVIECPTENGMVAQAVCSIPVYSTGETLFDSLSIYDLNSRDTLTYDWDFSEMLFQTSLAGENNEQLTIAFPDPIDQDWEETRFSLSVTDGVETSSVEVILTNPNYVVNVAPIIICENSNDCRYTISGVGEYTFTSFSVTDEGEDDPIEYTWTATGNPFDVNQVGNNPVISFPAQADTTWQSFTLTLTVSDGDLEDTQLFTIVNANYNSGNGGATSAPTPSSGGGSGGSMGFGLILLGLIAYLRRKV